MRNKTVLFVCTGNAGRSQIAQALFQSLAGRDAEAYSAGVDPWADLHPVARRLLAARGIDVSVLHPKHVARFVGGPLDYVVTIGDRARDETPRLGANPVRMHWDISDPADADGTGKEEAVFHATLDQIAARLPALLALIQDGTAPADMRLAPGISTCIVRPARFDPAVHLPAIAAAGFKCIELNCYLGSDDFAWDRPAALRELRRVADDTGVGVYSVHAAGGIGGMRGGCSEALSLDLYKAYADLAADVGAAVVAIHAGLPAGEDRAAAAAQLRGTLAELSGHVLGMPCRYAWENEAAGLSSAEHLDWIRGLYPGSFGFVLDNGHAHISGTTQAYLAGCRDLLCDLHLSDNDGKTDTHRMPGAGSFPWSGFMGTVQRCDYTGPVMLEVTAPERQDDLAALLADSRAAVDAIVQAGKGDAA